MKYEGYTEEQLNILLKEAYKEYESIPERGKRTDQKVMDRVKAAKKDISEIKDALMALPM